jgi:hypothetical protein
MFASSGSGDGLCEDESSVPLFLRVCEKGGGPLANRADLGMLGVSVRFEGRDAKGDAFPKRAILGTDSCAV